MAGVLSLETPAEAPVQTAPRRSPLTIRSIGEILAMTFDDSEMILPNGYLAAGERTAICGMGGVGKSRLTMQLALCCRTGRDFVGWKTSGCHLRWLFLQTENSCRRLQADLQPMLQDFSTEERDAIIAGISFHTLEEDDDGFLFLDSENLARISAAIEQTQADIVVYDPLRDFGTDDLNSDKHMTDTLREIGRLTRRGNPRRVPLVIHHAGTGKAGIQKATGFDRSSFGRNSKVLFGWVRAQINVAPARPDDNSLLIMASGKCSNSPEFEPFAIRLDPETMLYQNVPDFDFEEWRESVHVQGSAADKLTVEAVLELLPETGSIPKYSVLERLADKGIGDRRARTFLDSIISESGSVYEWRLKRSGKRDDIQLSRYAQADAPR